MPLLDYIDVRVHADGEPIKEYRDPLRELDDTRSRTRYIEAKAGQQFSVIVRIMPNFPLRNATWLYSQFSIDDSDSYHSGAIGETGLQLRNHYIQSPATVLDGRTMTVYDDSTGRWMDSAFTFGALGTSEGVYDHNEHKIEDISKIGSIRVKFFRAKRQTRQKAYTWEGEEPKTVDELPERVLKGRDIKTNTKYVPIREASPPRPQKYVYVPIKGSNGRPYEFTFLYRTRKALQNIGCIERSPSPPPDPKVMMDRLEDMVRQQKQEQKKDRSEIRRLREELARAQTGSRASSATAAADDEPTVIGGDAATNTGSTTTRKRSRDDFEADNDLAETAPPAKAPRVEVDLTGDDSDDEDAWYL